VFVGTDVELEVLSQHAEQIQKDTGATVIVSPISAVQIADDKWKTVEFLKANGFPYPASCLADEVEAFMQNQPFPLIVKPRIGARSIGLYKVHSREELDDALAHTPNAIIQEYLSDEDSEYTCSAFFWKGTCYGVLTGKRWLRNGDTYKADFTNNPELEAFIETVGKKLDIFGPCNFQLRMTEKGPVIFEINCRFSGTTGAMSYLGFNIVNALVQTVCLNRPVRQLKSREAYMFRYWNEEFVQRSDVATLREKGELQGPESKKNIF
jgi:carbamoyl-phosphate synthase large subunit